MATWKNEEEAREQIKALVTEYYHDFKENKKTFQDGDRITYAARVFDEKEMCALTDATLDFWLTTGRFAVPPHILPPEDPPAECQYFYS